MLGLCSPHTRAALPSHHLQGAPASFRGCGLHLRLPATACRNAGSNPLSPSHWGRGNHSSPGHPASQAAHWPCTVVTGCPTSKTSGSAQGSLGLWRNVSRLKPHMGQIKPVGMSEKTESPNISTQCRWQPRRRTTLTSPKRPGPTLNSKEPLLVPARTQEIVFLLMSRARGGRSSSLVPGGACRHKGCRRTGTGRPGGSPPGWGFWARLELLPVHLRDLQPGLVLTDSAVLPPPCPSRDAPPPLPRPRWPRTHPRRRRGRSWPTSGRSRCGPC